jgi:tetratricopeptide (TPR) repeat protein
LAAADDPNTSAAGEPGSDEEDGEPLIRNWGDLISYPLALDDHDRSRKAYLTSVESNRIPTVVVVGQTGLVEWIGHPRSLEGPLQQVLGGSWNRDEFKDQFARLQTSSSTLAQIDEALNGGQHVLAVELTKKLLAIDPRDVRALDRRAKAYYAMGRFAEANVDIVAVAELTWNDRQSLIDCGRRLLMDMPPSSRDLANAVKVIRRASELSLNLNAELLDMLAQALAAQGDYRQAVAAEKAAVALGDNSSYATHQTYSDRLAEYEAELQNRIANGTLNESPQESSQGDQPQPPGYGS